MSRHFREELLQDLRPEYLTVATNPQATDVVLLDGPVRVFAFTYEAPTQTKTVKLLDANTEKLFVGTFTGEKAIHYAFTGGGLVFQTEVRLQYSAGSLQEQKFSLLYLREE